MKFLKLDWDLETVLYTVNKSNTSMRMNQSIIENELFGHHHHNSSSSSSSNVLPTISLKWTSEEENIFFEVNKFF